MNTTRKEPFEGYVRIKSKRVCHKSIYGKVGEVFGCCTSYSGVIKYGVSLDGKDYEFYEHELEEATI